MLQTSAEGYVEANLIDFCAKTQQDSFPGGCADHKGTCTAPRKPVAAELGVCWSSADVASPCTAKQTASALHPTLSQVFTPR